MSRRFAVMLTHEPDDGSWTVAVPVLPGCYSSGFTVEEALENVKEAISLYLAVLEERGQPIPGEEEVQATIVEVA